MTSGNFQQQAQLLEQSKDPEERLALITQVRDNMDILHTGQYVDFLKYMLPAFQKVFASTPPFFIESTEQKVRHTMLEIFRRIPSTQPLAEHVGILFDLVMSVLAQDNETNATLCLKIIFELHKVFPKYLIQKVQPFVDFLAHQYKNFPRMVQEIFANSHTLSAPTTEEARQNVPQNQNTPRMLLRGTRSFQVLSECPIIVMLLVQTHSSDKQLAPTLDQQITQLSGLMMEALKVSVEDPQNYLKLVPNRDDPDPHPHPSTSWLPQVNSPAHPHHPMHEQFSQFIRAQVKSMSFLIWTMRRNPDSMQTQVQDLVSQAIKLLAVCPSSQTLARKELLIALTHIHASPFKKLLCSQVHVLLTPEILLGSNHTVFAESSRFSSTEGPQPIPAAARNNHVGVDLIRPLAFSTLSEIVCSVRETLREPLTLAEYARIVAMYTRNVQDETLPLQTQHASVRLLVNLLSEIGGLKDPERRNRGLLIQILRSIVSKFQSLRYQVSQLLLDVRKQQRSHRGGWVSFGRIPDPETGVKLSSGADTSEDGVSASDPESEEEQGEDQEVVDTAVRIITNADLEFRRDDEVARKRRRRLLAGLRNQRRLLEGSSSPSPDPEDGTPSSPSVVRDAMEDDSESDTEAEESLVDDDSELSDDDELTYGVRQTPTLIYLSHNRDFSAWERLRATRDLITTMVIGLKNTLWFVTNFGRTNKRDETILMREDEVALVSDFLEHGLHCLSAYDGLEQLRLEHELLEDTDSEDEDGSSSSSSSTAGRKSQRKRRKRRGGARTEKLRAREQRELYQETSLEENGVGIEADDDDYVPLVYGSGASSSIPGTPAAQAFSITPVDGWFASWAEELQQVALHECEQHWEALAGWRNPDLPLRPPKGPQPLGSSARGVSSSSGSVSSAAVDGAAPGSLVWSDEALAAEVADVDRLRQRGGRYSAAIQASLKGITEEELVTRGNARRLHLWTHHRKPPRVLQSAGSGGYLAGMVPGAGAGGHSHHHLHPQSWLARHRWKLIQQRDFVEKTILGQFAEVFTMLDPRTFREVFSQKIEVFFQQFIAHPKLPLHVIAELFLTSPIICRPFADVLLNFLVNRMHEMALPSPNSPAAGVILSLFRVVFRSVMVFPDNEIFLQPYLTLIVTRALHFARRVEYPMNFLTLIRALFRSIGGGKYDLLYKEFLPVLPEIFHGLLEIQTRYTGQVRETAIELTLTVPARLSSLLRHIPLLIRAVLRAIQTQDEQIVKLGLRTLDFWVDNLNQHYLYPQMEPVLNEMMRSLTALLRPKSCPFGAAALTVLGKLGGRNRRFLIESFSLNNKLSSSGGGSSGHGGTPLAYQDNQFHFSSAGGLGSGVNQHLPDAAPGFPRDPLNKGVGVQVDGQFSVPLQFQGYWVHDQETGKRLAWEAPKPFKLEMDGLILETSQALQDLIQSQQAETLIRKRTLHEAASQEASAQHGRCLHSPSCRSCATPQSLQRHMNALPQHGGTSISHVSQSGIASLTPRQQRILKRINVQRREEALSNSMKDGTMHKLTMLSSSQTSQLAVATEAERSHAKIQCYLFLRSSLLRLLDLSPERSRWWSAEAESRASSVPGSESAPKIPTPQTAGKKSDVSSSSPSSRGAADSTTGSGQPGDGIQQAPSETNEEILAVQTRAQRQAQAASLRAVLRPIIIAASDTELSRFADTRAAAFVRQLARHFALVFASGAQARHDASAKTESSQLSAQAWFDVIVELMCHKEAAWAEAAERHALGVFVDTLLAVSPVSAVASGASFDPSGVLVDGEDEAGVRTCARRGSTSTERGGSSPSRADCVNDSDAEDSPEQNMSSPPPSSSSNTLASSTPSSATEDDGSVIHPCISHLVRRLTHSCYGQSEQEKRGGCVGLTLLVHRLPPLWVVQNHTSLIRALLFTLQDMPSDYQRKTQELAQMSLQKIMNTCCSNLPPADLPKDDSSKMMDDDASGPPSEKKEVTESEEDEEEESEGDSPPNTRRRTRRMTRATRRAAKSTPPKEEKESSAQPDGTTPSSAQNETPKDAPTVVTVHIPVPGIGVLRRLIRNSAQALPGGLPVFPSQLTPEQEQAVAQSCSLTEEARAHKRTQSERIALEQQIQGCEQQIQALQQQGQSLQQESGRQSKQTQAQLSNLEKQRHHYEARLEQFRNQHQQYLQFEAHTKQQLAQVMSKLRTEHLERVQSQHLREQQAWLRQLQQLLTLQVEGWQKEQLNTSLSVSAPKTSIKERVEVKGIHAQAIAAVAIQFQHTFLHPSEATQSSDPNLRQKLELSEAQELERMLSMLQQQPVASLSYLLKDVPSARPAADPNSSSHGTEGAGAPDAGGQPPAPVRASNPDPAVYHGPATEDVVSATLERILHTMTPEQQRRFQFIRNLVKVLAPELLSSISAVRKCTQILLQKLANRCGHPVSNLLSIYRNRLMLPAQQQSLPALPLSTRIGFVSTAAFGLNLRPRPLLSTRELQSLIRQGIEEFGGSPSSSSTPAAGDSNPQGLSKSASGRPPSSSSATSSSGSHHHSRSSSSSTSSSNRPRSGSMASSRSSMQFGSSRSAPLEEEKKLDLMIKFKIEYLRLMAAALKQSEDMLEISQKDPSFFAPSSLDHTGPLPESMRKSELAHMVEAMGRKLLYVPRPLALTDPEAYKDLKKRVISIFFRCLLSSDARIVREAHIGLKSVMQRQKMPKELLHDCLRPVLKRLADRSQLSIPLLNGLRRLLELLSSYFSATLGHKLFEHLHYFATPTEDIRRMGEHVKMATIIVDLFHMLPAEDQFARHLILITLKLEQLLPSLVQHCGGGFGVNSASPYRQPLIKYFNTYPMQCLEVLRPVFPLPPETLLSFSHPLAALAAGSVAAPAPPSTLITNLLGTPFVEAGKAHSLFLDILADPNAEAFRQHLMQNSQQLLQWTFHAAWIPGVETVLDPQLRQQYQANDLEADDPQSLLRSLPFHSQLTYPLDSLLPVSSRQGQNSHPGLPDLNALKASYTQALNFVQASLRLPSTDPLDTRIVRYPDPGAAAGRHPQPQQQQQQQQQSPPPQYKPTTMDGRDRLRMRIRLVSLGVRIADILSGFCSEWLVLQPSVVSCLLQCWLIPKLGAEGIGLGSVLPLSEFQQRPMLSSILIRYARLRPEAWGVPFLLLWIFTQPRVEDFSELQHFLSVELAQNLPVHAKKKLLDSFLRFFTDNLSHPEPYAPVDYRQMLLEATLSVALRLLVLPLLSGDPQAGVTHRHCVPRETLLRTLRKQQREASPGDPASFSSDSVSESKAPELPRRRSGRRASQRAQRSIRAVMETGGSMEDDSDSEDTPADPLLDPEGIKVLIQDMITGVFGQSVGDELRVELLRLLTLLIGRAPHQLKGFREEIMRYSWSQLKGSGNSRPSPDLAAPYQQQQQQMQIHQESRALIPASSSLVRQHASVSLCRFVESFRTPNQILLQNFVQLLRLSDAEPPRELVQEALDQLLPALPARMPPNQRGSASWIKWTKKMLMEEGHQLPQLIHVLGVIVRHPDLFYHSRMHFVFLIVNCLFRLGAPANRPLESRKLSVDLAELIIRWDIRRIREQRLRKHREAEQERQTQTAEEDSAAAEKSTPALRRGGSRKRRATATGDNETSTAPSSKRQRTNSSASVPMGSADSSHSERSPSVEDFTPTPDQIKIILSFLQRMAMLTCQDPATQFLGRHCVRLFALATKIWPHGELQLDSIDHMLHDRQPAHREILLSCTVELLLPLIRHQRPAVTLFQYHARINQIVGTCLRRPHPITRHLAVQLVGEMITAMEHRTLYDLQEARTDAKELAAEHEEWLRLEAEFEKAQETHRQQHPQLYNPTTGFPLPTPQQRQQHQQKQEQYNQHRLQHQKSFPGQPFQAKPPVAQLDGPPLIPVPEELLRFRRRQFQRQRRENHRIIRRQTIETFLAEIQAIIFKSLSASLAPPPQAGQKEANHADVDILSTVRLARELTKNRTFQFRPSPLDPGSSAEPTPLPLPPLAVIQYAPAADGGALVYPLSPPSAAASGQQPPKAFKPGRYAHMMTYLPAHRRLGLLERDLGLLVQVLHRLAKLHVGEISLAPPPPAPPAAPGPGQKTSKSQSSSSSSTSRGSQGRRRSSGSSQAAAASSSSAPPAAATASSRGSRSSGSRTADLLEMVDHEGRSMLSETLLQCLDLVRDFAAKLGPTDKKAYFTVLLLLIDKSGDVPLLQHIADTVRDWILPPRADLVELSSAAVPPVPELSVKEKANFLLRMCRFEMLHHSHLMMRFQEAGTLGGFGSSGSGSARGGGVPGQGSLSPPGSSLTPLTHQYACSHTHLGQRGVEAFVRRHWIKKNTKLWQKLTDNRENVNPLFGLEPHQRQQHHLRSRPFTRRRRHVPSLVGLYMETAQMDSEQSEEQEDVAVFMNLLQQRQDEQNPTEILLITFLEILLGIFAENYTQRLQLRVARPEIDTQPTPAPGTDPQGKPVSSPGLPAVESAEDRAWLTKLQRPFMAGLRCSRLEYRRLFARIFHSAIGHSLFDALYYVLGVQDWEGLHEGFWLAQALDMVLNVAEPLGPEQVPQKVGLMVPAFDFGLPDPSFKVQQTRASPQDSTSTQESGARLTDSDAEDAAPVSTDSAEDSLYALRSAPGLAATVRGEPVPAKVFLDREVRRCLEKAAAAAENSEEAEEEDGDSQEPLVEDDTCALPPNIAVTCLTSVDPRAPCGVTASSAAGEDEGEERSVGRTGHRYTWEGIPIPQALIEEVWDDRTLFGAPRPAILPQTNEFQPMSQRQHLQRLRYSSRLNSFNHLINQGRDGMDLFAESEDLEDLIFQLDEDDLDFERSEGDTLLPGGLTPTSADMAARLQQPQHVGARSGWDKKHSDPAAFHSGHRVISLIEFNREALRPSLLSSQYTRADIQRAEHVFLIQFGGARRRFSGRNNQEIRYLPLHQCRKPPTSVLSPSRRMDLLNPESGGAEETGSFLALRPLRPSCVDVIGGQMDSSPPEALRDSASYCLSDLMRYLPRFCHRIWVSVFPQAWTQLNHTQQLQLSACLNRLLAQDWIAKSWNRRTEKQRSHNVVQSLLEGILRIQTCRPTLQPWLLKYLAKSFNAWNLSLQLLEDQLQAGAQELDNQGSLVDSLVMGLTPEPTQTSDLVVRSADGSVDRSALLEMFEEAYGGSQDEDADAVGDPGSEEGDRKPSNGRTVHASGASETDGRMEDDDNGEASAALEGENPPKTGMELLRKFWEQQAEQKRRLQQQRLTGAPKSQLAPQTLASSPESLVMPHTHPLRLTVGEEVDIEDTYDALGRLYQSLGARDAYLELWKCRAKTSVTKTALTMEQFGSWTRAQDMFFKARSQYQINPSHVLVRDADQPEILLWEQEWIHCAKELDQWEILWDFGRTVNQPELQLQSSWRLGKWEALRSLLSQYQLGETAEGRLYQVYTAVHDRASLRGPNATNPQALAAADRLVFGLLERAMQLSLQEWQTLPSFVGAAHENLLRRFHRLVEVRESLQLLSTASTNAAAAALAAQSGRRGSGSGSGGPVGQMLVSPIGPTVPQTTFKNFTKTWRDRLCNDWEDISIWSDVLTWRLHFYQLTDRLFSGTAAGAAAGTGIPGATTDASGRKVPVLVDPGSVNPSAAAPGNASGPAPPQPSIRTHDAPWTVTKFAKIARKQSLTTVCLTALNTLYGFQYMDANSTFNKLREQILTCIQTPSDCEGALNLIRSTNLDYLSLEQQAEMFRLEGEALQQLGYGDDSHAAYSASLSVCDTYGKGWKSWGLFCDRVLAIKGDLSWGEHVIVCYLQAIAHKAKNARLLIPRILWLLSHDGHPNGPINAAFGKWYPQVAVWVWILWIPQLMASLVRPEKATAKAILCSIARHFPQSIYYTIRANLIERRDLRSTAKQQQQQQQQQQQTTGGASSSGGGSSSSGGGGSQASGVDEVLNELRKAHPSLMTEIERMLDELYRRFKPEPEEELLGAVHALILKCYKQLLSAKDIIPISLCLTIRRVCQKFFTVDPSAANRQHQEFVLRYKSSFERSFLPPPYGTEFPTTLTELIQKLQRWKHHLHYRVGGSESVNLKLERLSPYLVRFTSYDIEIPGQYSSDQNPRTQQRALLTRFHTDVRIQHTHGFSHRRVGMVGSDGAVRYFQVQYTISHITRSDERMQQFSVLLNQMMDDFKETRKRGLRYFVPIVVPLTHRLRLMECNPATVSLEEIYDQDCARRQMPTDLPLTLYRERMRRVEGCEMNQTARLQVYEEICNTLVPKNVLQRFFQSTIRTPDEFWAFRSELGNQVAVSGYLSYLFKVGDRALHKLAICCQTGRLINHEFYPSYNDRYIADCLEPVPFRLTRNFTQLLGPTPALVEGIMCASITAVNSCMYTNQDTLKNYLSLFLREDIVSWNSTKNPNFTDVYQLQMEKRLRGKIKENRDLILRRMLALMSAPDRDRAPTPINHRVQSLVAMATNKTKICLMSPLWSPWF